MNGETRGNFGAMYGGGGWWEWVGRACCGRGVSPSVTPAAATTTTAEQQSCSTGPGGQF